jgi:DedD protein
LKSAGFYRNSLDKSNPSVLDIGRDNMRRNYQYEEAAMPPLMLDDQIPQDSHRAKWRIGVAAALLLIAISILIALNKRHEDSAEDAPETPKPFMQTSLSSTDMEVPDALPEASSTEAEPIASAEEPSAPPPPPEPGKLPESSASTQPGIAAPGPEEESSGAPHQQSFVASAAQTLSQSRMSATAVQSPARTSNISPPAPLAAKGYAVQLGVFTDIENAKQLQAQLAAHGIPSHTETRVQIGPFKSREEADQAREKLKKLGISAVIRSQ